MSTPNSGVFQGPYTETKGQRGACNASQWPFVTLLLGTHPTQMLRSPTQFAGQYAVGRNLDKFEDASEVAMM
jgi:hypothetical protein